MRTRLMTAVFCTTLLGGLGVASLPNSDLSQFAYAGSMNSTATAPDFFSKGFPRRSLSRRTEPQPSCDPLILSSIRRFNEDITSQGAEKLGLLIEAKAKKYDVDPYLVVALVSQESAFYQNAVSSVGALGLGQLMPGTAKDLGVNPRKAEENLDGCVRYLAQHLDTWSCKRDPVALALASYNAGAGNVGYYGGIPPFDETRHYVKVIKHRYAVLRSGRALDSAYG